MKTFIQQAIYPAIGFLLGTILSKYVLPLILKKSSWKTTWRGFLFLCISWGLYSIIATTINFFKIPDDVALHKAEVLTVAFFAINFQVLICAVTIFACIYILNKKDKETKE